MKNIDRFLCRIITLDALEVKKEKCIDQLLNVYGLKKEEVEQYLEALNEKEFSELRTYEQTIIYENMLNAYNIGFLGKTHIGQRILNAKKNAYVVLKELCVKEYTLNNLSINISENKAKSILGMVYLYNLSDSDNKEYGIELIQQSANENIDSKMTLLTLKPEKAEEILNAMASDIEFLNDASELMPLFQKYNVKKKKVCYRKQTIGFSVGEL